MAPTNFANVRDRRDSGLEEKLVTASEAGNAALVKRLIKKGANVHFVENPELGYNALHYAAFNGYIDVAEGLVLAGAEVNRVTTDHYTALMLASMGGFTDLVEHLFLISQPDLSIRTKEPGQATDGSTCLHLAVLSGQDRLVRLLLVQGAEREATNKMGYTALHLAAEMGFADILATLLDAVPSLHSSSEGASSALHLTAQGRTALHLAAVSGTQECVAALLADNASDVNVLDNEGYTALHLALSHGQRRTAELLLRQGVAVNTQARDGSTPLLTAVLSGDVKLVDLLMQYSADLAVANSNGTSALMVAACAGREKVVRALLLNLRGGSDKVRRALCNQQDQIGDTALHCAVHLGHEGIIQRLVDAGAAATIANFAGETALSLARNRGNRRISALMLKARAPLRAGEEGSDADAAAVDADADADTNGAGMDRSVLFSDGGSVLVDHDGAPLTPVSPVSPTSPHAEGAAEQTLLAAAARDVKAAELMAEAEKFLAEEESSDVKDAVNAQLMDLAEQILVLTSAPRSTGDAPSPPAEPSRLSPASPRRGESVPNAKAEAGGEDVPVGTSVDEAGTAWRRRSESSASISGASNASDDSWDVVSDHDVDSAGSVDFGNDLAAESMESPARETAAFQAGDDSARAFNVGSASPPGVSLGAFEHPRRRGRRQHADATSMPRDSATKAAKRALRKAARQANRLQRQQQRQQQHQSQQQGCHQYDASFGSDSVGCRQDESWHSSADALPAYPSCALKEAQLQQLQASYASNLAAVSEEYQARIAALQDQLRQYQSLSEGDDHQELHSSFEWDQEIEFLVAPPGTRGEARYAGMRSPLSPRSPRGSPRGTPAGTPGEEGSSPRANSGRSPRSPQAGGEGSVAGEPAGQGVHMSSLDGILGAGRRERRLFGPGAAERLRPDNQQEESGGIDRAGQGVRMSSREGLPGSGEQGRRHPGPSAEELLRAGDPRDRHTGAPPSAQALTESRLTELDRRFLQVLSAVLLLVAVALLVFIRVRLMGR